MVICQFELMISASVSQRDTKPVVGCFENRGKVIGCESRKRSGLDIQLPTLRLDRIVRARYRLGPKYPPSLITPEQVYEYTIDLGDTATVFREGHRIRLEVSSSNFPHFDRNLNTGGRLGEDAEFVSATQTIYHEATHPSFIELQIAPDVRVPVD